MKEIVATLKVGHETLSKVAILVISAIWLVSLFLLKDHFKISRLNYLYVLIYPFAISLVIWSLLKLSEKKDFRRRAFFCGVLIFSAVLLARFHKTTGWGVTLLTNMFLFEAWTQSLVW